MEEKERMLNGLPYLESSPVLLQERENAKQLCYKYNKCAPNNKTKK